MPKLDRFAKRGKPDPLEKITGKKEMKQILEAFRATERYVMLNLIAAGLLQILAARLREQTPRIALNLRAKEHIICV